jgi:hypothetical protein
MMEKVNKHWMTRDEYSQRMHFEHELINRRLGWLLTSESILLAAYGLAIGKEPIFLGVVAGGGLVISLVILLGVRASQDAKHQIWEDFKASGNSDANEEFWVRTSITKKAFFPETMLPLVFAVMWIALGLLSW